MKELTTKDHVQRLLISNAVPLIFIALSAVAVMGVHALSRVRLAADVAIVVLAAIGIEVLLRRFFPRPGGLAFDGPPEDRPLEDESTGSDHEPSEPAPVGEPSG